MSIEVFLEQDFGTLESAVLTIRAIPAHCAASPVGGGESLARSGALVCSAVFLAPQPPFQENTPQGESAGLEGWW
jgi:hypothetical protein